MISYFGSFFFILEESHETGRKLQISRPQLQKMSSSQSCSHRNSVQNAPIDKLTALTGTTFVTISVFISRGQKLTPITKSVVVTKLFAPKFCAEWSDREIDSSHGDHFLDNFCFYVSGRFWPPLANNLWATFGQLLDNFWTAPGLSGNIWAPRHKNRNGRKNSPRESCEFVDRCILHRISVRTFL